MTTHPQLDSAAAVEVAAFCWPTEAWEEIPDSDGNAQSCIIHDQDCEKWEPCSFFSIYDFNDLHRAAAVLVERGHGLKISGFMVDEWRLSQAKIHYQDWFLAAPADAWARAILATVREVSK